MRDPYLQAMGIEQWVRREPHPQPIDTAEDNSIPASTPISDAQINTVSEIAPEISASEIELTATQSRESHNVEGLDWIELENRVAQCTVCDLHVARTNVVFGAGDTRADWMIVGEAPGAEEDKQAQPFVGHAGQLLTAMLQAMGLKREQVYITNILKCHPPENRDPLPDEIQCCQTYLHRQIELVQPKIIIAFGRTAAQGLLDQHGPMKEMRGQRFKYADTGIPVVVTYHPAYLLRKPSEKRKSWQDLQFAMKLFSSLDAEV